MVFWWEEESGTQNAVRALVRGTFESRTQRSGPQVQAAQRVEMQNSRQESAEMPSKAVIVVPIIATMDGVLPGAEPGPQRSPCTLQPVR